MEIVLRTTPNVLEWDLLKIYKDGKNLIQDAIITIF